MMPDGDSPKPDALVSDARAADAKASAPAVDPADAANAAEDVVLAYAPTEDGEGTRVLRKRAERIEAGEVRPLKEGKPIVGEVVRLKPREGSPGLHDVEVLAKVDGHGTGRIGPTGVHKGPAQVASEKYRESWDRVFGGRDERALN